MLDMHITFSQKNNLAAKKNNFFLPIFSSGVEFLKMLKKNY